MKNFTHQANPSIFLKRAIFLILGYATAIIVSALFYSFLMTCYAAYLNSSVFEIDNFIAYTFYSVYYGSFLGLPYTAIGSILVHFVLPRHILVFLFVGMFCPASALLLLYWNSWDRDLPSMLLLSFPPGLVAAYLYGAIGFGYGFGKWKSYNP